MVSRRKMDSLIHLDCVWSISKQKKRHAFVGDYGLAGDPLLSGSSVVNLRLEVKQQSGWTGSLVRAVPGENPHVSCIIRIKGTQSLKPCECPANGLSGLPLGKSGTLQT